MNTYVAFGVAAAATFLLRSSMTIAGDRFTRSQSLLRVTALVTPAVLAAMVAAAVLVHHGQVSSPAWAEVAAVAAAFAVTRRTGNVGLALAAGLPVYWLGSLVHLL